MKLEIPDNNDAKLIEAVKRLLKISSKHTIMEIYGKPTKNSFVGSGRTNIFADNMTKSDMIKRVNSFKRLGIDYNYTINGIMPRATMLENRALIIKELQWIESSPIKTITVANYELARMAEKYCPSVGVIASFFTGVDSKKRMFQWAKLPNVKAVITDRGTYRNLPLLKELVEIGKKHDVGVRVIANLGCMADCMRTEEHAIIKDLASVDAPSLHCAPCTFYCMRHLLENPEEILQLPIIRPEDLDIYEKIGIEAVKLVDRSQTISWIEKIVGYYLRGSYKGNILDLTCNFTTLDLEKMSTKQVAKINIKEVMKSRKGIRNYRRILPVLLGVSIDHNHNLLGCSGACERCAGCKTTSAVKYDKARRKVVLKQLKKLEKDYLFA